jgi:hypothetical protein
LPCPPETQAALNAVLRPLDLSWHLLEERATQIVLFGSRAAETAREDSDWDLLVVGGGRRVRTQRADLIWIPPAFLGTERWLGSELATHVAIYGRWLVGEDDWRDRAHVSADAVRRKKMGLSLQLRELERLWPSLLPGAQARHLRRLRRETQRLWLLRNGEAVPPTRHLDEAWAAGGGSPREELPTLSSELERV